MALKQFHLIKDRYLFDDFESGLYFDMYPVKRTAGENEDAFNGRIDEANEEILRLAKGMSGEHVYYCTLFLNSVQLNSLSLKYKNQFASKSWLLWFRADFDGKELPSTPWLEMGSGGFMCNPTGLQKDWRYYTSYDANSLGHRLRRVAKDEVDSYVMPGGVVVPPVVEPPIENPNGNPSDICIHFKCPHCGKIII